MEGQVNTIDRGAERRIRRIAQFPLTRLFVAIVAIAIALAVANALVSTIATPAWWVRPLATIIAVHGAYVAYVRFYERRAAAELDRWTAGRELLLGFAGGVGLVGLVLTTVWLAGGYEIEAWNGWAGIARALGVAAGAAYVEEVLFRGVVYRLFEELIGT